jgi:hypothetical protein
VPSGVVVKVKSDGDDGKAVTKVLQFTGKVVPGGAMKPEPVIKTEVPGPPLVGVRVKLDVTRNCVVDTSFAALPVAVTV